MSLNGIIAGKQGVEEFISLDSWETFVEDIHKVGTIIWGRKTYENIKTWDKKFINDIHGVKAIIISGNSNYQVNKGFEIATSPQEAIEKLQNYGFEKAILTGGSTLNSSFAKLNLIDEVIINIEPVIVGSGIPLFHPDVFQLNLEFIEMTKPRGKLIQLHYKVIK